MDKSKVIELSKKVTELVQMANPDYGTVWNSKMHEQKESILKILIQ